MLTDGDLRGTINMLRPDGTSDIFAESAWLPSLERYIHGDMRNPRTQKQDDEMILRVREALEKRGEVLIVQVRMTIAIPSTVCHSLISAENF